MPSNSAALLFLEDRCYWEGATEAVYLLSVMQIWCTTGLLATELKIEEMRCKLLVLQMKNEIGCILPTLQSAVMYMFSLKN